MLSNKVIKITFNEPIKMGNGLIELTNSIGTTLPINNPIINGNKLTITPTDPLIEDTYTITLYNGSITDIAGNPIEDWSSIFKVIPPSVIAIDPTNGAVNVPLTQVITVVFNEPVKIGSGVIELTTVLEQ